MFWLFTASLHRLHLAMRAGRKLSKHCNLHPKGLHLEADNKTFTLTSHHFFHSIFYIFYMHILERTTCCSKDIWLQLMTWLLNQLIMESMPFGFNLFKSKTLLPDCTCLSHLNKIWRFQHKFPLSNVLFHLLLSIYC